jgi:hypothetical protein
LFVLSAELGQETFPYHPNWKMDECHIAYWDLYPTIDHVVPIALGGANDPSNWVTTSQVTNSSKANFTVEELGWEVLSPGDLAEWDGLLGWFLRYAEGNASLESDTRISDWLRESRWVALRTGS